MSALTGLTARQAARVAGETTKRIGRSPGMSGEQYAAELAITRELLYPKDTTRQPGGIVVLGPWAWGHGADLAEAKRNFRAQGARLSDGYAVLEFPETVVFAGVDGLGRVSWRAADGVDIDPQTVEPKVTVHEPKAARR